MALNLSLITYGLRVKGWTGWVMCDIPDVKIIYLHYNIVSLYCVKFITLFCELGLGIIVVFFVT